MTQRQYFSKQSTIGPLLGLAVALIWGVVDARAVDPNPLESAYWRFEEGPVNERVEAGPVGGPEIGDTVIDSINDNFMRAFAQPHAPTYVAAVPPTPLQSGLTNTLSLAFDDFEAPQDIYSVNENIDRAYFVDGDHGFTLEAAFNVSDMSQFRTIVAKEGRHSLADPDEYALGIWPTMRLTVRGPEYLDDPDAGKLEIELFDGVGTQVSVMSPDQLDTNQWYYAAVVSDGATNTLSLYLDRNDTNGYVLQGSTPANGAMYQGPDAYPFDNDENMDGNDFLVWQRGEGNNTEPTDLAVFLGDFGNPLLEINELVKVGDDYVSGPDWQGRYTVGRGDFVPVADGGVGYPEDSFNGMIDEVRLSNTALDPSEFLFAPGPTALGVPEPAALGLAGLALAGALLARRRRPR